MTYSKVKEIFQEWNRKRPGEELTAHIVFTMDSFKKEYPLLSRTYAVSSNNKAFRPNMGGYSIFGDSLDGTDLGVRLEGYMAEEGNPGGWKVEDCYILEQMRDAAAIPSLSRVGQKDGTVCYFFGDTTIRAEENVEDGKLRLTPISGDQVGPDGWVELEMDRVYGYCALLERHLTEPEAR